MIGCAYVRTVWKAKQLSFYNKKKHKMIDDDKLCCPRLRLHIGCIAWPTAMTEVTKHTIHKIIESTSCWRWLQTINAIQTDHLYSCCQQVKQATFRGKAMQMRSWVRHGFDRSNNQGKKYMLTYNPKQSSKKSFDSTRNSKAYAFAGSVKCEWPRGKTALQK